MLSLELELAGLAMERRTCRLCKQRFSVAANGARACRYHPESFTGETAQRWLAPGDALHRNDVHSFYSCCGASDRDAPGCCYSAHVTYDETPSVSMRRPGMAIESTDRQHFNGFVPVEEEKPRK